MAERKSLLSEEITTSIKIERFRRTATALRKYFEIKYENSELQSEGEEPPVASESHGDRYNPKYNKRYKDGSLDLQVISIDGDDLIVVKRYRHTDGPYIEKITLNTSVGQFQYYKGPEDPVSQNGAGVPHINDARAAWEIRGFISRIPQKR